MTNASRLLCLCLGGLIVSLLLVGVVSTTPLRHFIQVVPAMIALGCVWRRIDWSGYAALPVFLVWLLIMSLIWLFLLGIAHIITGTFSTAERVLTITSGLSCVIGIGATFRVGSPKWWRRVVAFVFFALLTIAAVWVSLQPSFAQR